jgi:GT2 family glycosyltransferase
LRIESVVLTMGDRPEELREALASVRAQHGVEVSTTVVLNGAGELSPDPGADRVIVTGENRGIPAGRNVGARGSTADLLLFLDDDATIAEPGALARLVRRFEADPSLAVVTGRISDPRTGTTERRHVPRLRVGDPERSSFVTTFLGGACLVRRSAFELAGRLPDEFHYAHEETSLAWRLLDRGYRLHYDSGFLVHHPATSPARHEGHRVRSARNRVLLARRHLPVPCNLLYVLDWLLLVLVRDPAGFGSALRGTLDGLRHPGVPREPISWRTVWRMAAIGRPPVV